jgi:hypothetical protein
MGNNNGWLSELTQFVMLLRIDDLTYISGFNQTNQMNVFNQINQINQMNQIGEVF